MADQQLSMTAAEYREFNKSGRLPRRIRQSDGPVDLAAIAQAANSEVADSRTAHGVDKGKKAPVRPRHVPGEMNKTEAAFASEYLDAEIAAGRAWEWTFEPFKLRLAKNTTYSPDFITVGPEGITVYEVKGGWVEDDAAVKWKVAAEKFWWMTFRMALVKIKKGRVVNIEWRDYQA